MIAYWLSQFNILFNRLYGIFYINITCDGELSSISDKNFNKCKEIEINMENNNLNIHFQKNALINFEANDNSKEKEIAEYCKSNGFSYYNSKSYNLD